MLSRVTIDRRRMGTAYEMFNPNKDHLNHFGAPSSGFWETVLKLFLKSTAKVILIMPYLMNAVGVVQFFLVVLFIGWLGYLKGNILVETSIKEGYFNYGLLLRKAFKTNAFVLVSVTECAALLVEYGFIIIQIGQILEGTELFRIIELNPVYPTVAICFFTHLAFLTSTSTRAKIVTFFSYMAFTIILIAFFISLISVGKFHSVSVNDLFFFNSGNFLQCIMFLISAFRGNKETLDLCRSYSKDEKIMRRLNKWNSVIFICFGWTFSFLYYMEYLPGSRSDYNARNALDIYKNAPQGFNWSLVFYTFCLMQMLNDNIQHTIHYLDNLFSAKMSDSKCVSFCLSIFFTVFNNLIIYRYQYSSVFLGVIIFFPNVFIGIPLLINLQVLPNQSLGKILALSSLVAMFFFFSLYSIINFSTVLSDKNQ